MMSPAYALEDFSKLRCEQPEMVQWIFEIVKTLQTEDGTPLASFVSVAQIGTPTTMIAQTNKISCKLRLNLSYQGTPNYYTGRLTIRQFATGKITIEFHPGY